METSTLSVSLTVRDLEPDDLADLDWSGGSEHVRALSDALQLSYQDDAELMVIVARNGQTVAVGAVDYRKRSDAGALWMLSVHHRWQSLGLGTILISALEDRIRRRGLSTAMLGVEHDNLRAAALYRRLGYRTTGMDLDGWSAGGNRHYVTVCTIMSRQL